MVSLSVCQIFINPVHSFTSIIQRVFKILANNYYNLSAVSTEDFGMDQASAPLISKPAGYQSVHTTDPNTQYPVGCEMCKFLDFKIVIVSYSAGHSNTTQSSPPRQ